MDIFESYVNKQTKSVSQFTFLVTDPKTKKVYKVLVVPATQLDEEEIREKWLGPVSADVASCSECGRPY